MGKVNTVSKVQVYELNGEDIPISADEVFLEIKSHWNQGDFVVLNFENNKTVTVLARDLVLAIGRCSE